MTIKTWLVTVATGVLAACLLAPQAAAQTPVDLPACEATAPGGDAQVSLGIAQPHAAETLVRYAARLTLADPTLNVCAESWSEVLPSWVPWAPALERGLGWAVFALAFVAAVTLLWFTTPRRWWQRTTLLGVLGVAGLTWVMAVAGLSLLQAVGAQRLVYDSVLSLRMPRQPGVEWLSVGGARDLEAMLAARDLLPAARQQVTAESTAEAMPAALPSSVAPEGAYRVAHRLNLRSGPGTQAPWLATLPRGETLQFDGAREGDWWRVRRANGAVGWCSSLWLRRPEEGLPPAAGG